MQLCVDRAMQRGLSSGRSDDNPEVFKKRLVAGCCSGVCVCVCVCVCVHV